MKRRRAGSWGKVAGPEEFSERDGFGMIRQLSLSERQSRGHIFPLEGGDWSLSLLRNPFRLHLLPRCFKKPQLRFEEV